MRKWKLAAAATAASGALAIGMFAAFSLTAKAGTVSAAGCHVTADGKETTALACPADNDKAHGNPLSYPQSITITAVTTPASLPVSFVWTAACTEPSSVVVTSGGTTLETPTSGGSATLDLVPHSAQMNNAISSTSCDLEVTATISGTSALTATDLDVTVQALESVPASPTPTATSPSPTPTKSTTPPAKTYNNQVHGFDGMCMDDHLNSSSVRAQVVVWQCNNKNPAQGWTFSGSELKIHGLCLNAKGNGKQNSKLILWTCNSSPNEIFSHRANGEFVEKANGWSLCLNDPGYSTKNGTQMIVYKCKNTANEHFTKP